MLNMVLGTKQAMNNRNAQAQENAANAQAQGQIGAAREGAQGNVYGTIYSQPANFGSIFGNIYGTQAGSNQGANYGDAFGNYQAGLANLGNNATGNFQAYAQGVQNLGSQGDPYGANSYAEAARQAAVGNIGAGALGAYGSSMNAALGAYGLQQQAYNLAMGQAMQANQGGLSSLGQSRNNALAGLGNAYAATSGSAAQLGGAGLNASQQSRTDTSSDQMARNRQSTRSVSSDQANMYGGGGGYYGDVSGGFNATGPGGQIASGSYGPAGGGDYGGNYDMGGSRLGYSESSGTNDSMARQVDRASQYTGPQMDAFRESLGAGMAGIGGALGGLYGAQAGVMDSGDREALMTGYNTGIDSLNRANEGYYDPRTESYVPGGRDIPGLMANQALGGLLALGQQGYDTSNRGMNQFYNNARYTLENSPQSQAMNALTAGYGTANNMLGGIGGMMAGGYADTVGNIDNVRSDLNRGADTARGDVQGLYDGSIGSWMGGGYNPAMPMLPTYDRMGQAERDRDYYEAMGYTYKPEEGRWVAPRGNKMVDGLPPSRSGVTFAYSNV